MISQAFTQNAFKVLSLFAVSPGSRLNRKEIKEKTKLNNIPLDEALLRLTSSKLIGKEGNYYSINFENEFSRKLIELCSKQQKKLKSLPTNVFFLLVDFVFQASLQKGTEAFLFGSYSKLIFHDKSDVDIAIVSPASQKTNKDAFEKLSEKLEELYKKQIQLHFFEKDTFYRNKKDPLVKEILKNGVRLI